MYQFSEDLEERALHFYTLFHCDEFDEDFYYQAAADSFFDPALSICITLDYLDILYETYLKNTPISSNQYKKTLDGRNEMDYNWFTRG